MRLFLTGASGEIGRPTITALRAGGHTVRAATRSDGGDRIVTALGAEPVRVDLFDPAAVRAAVGDADAIVHLATAIPASAQMGDLATWELNDRLRQETTEHLADAAVANGTATVLLQSYFAVQPPSGAELIEGGPRSGEPGWSGIGVMDSMRDAERTMHRLQERGVGSVVLRFGSLYSPTSEQLQAQVAMLRSGGAAIPGDGSNYWPYLSSADAADAIQAGLALRAGTFDVTDDDPVTLAAFWATAARTVGVAVPPLAPDVGGPMADVLLGSWRLSNRPFAAATGWSPRTASVLEGWPAAARVYMEARPGLRPS